MIGRDLFLLFQVGSIINDDEIPKEAKRPKRRRIGTKGDNKQNEACRKIIRKYKRYAREIEFR